MFPDLPERDYSWVCFKCNKKHPNTLRYCPICGIAKTHSDNLRESKKRKKK